jgi:hypothetical protein
MNKLNFKKPVINLKQFGTGFLLAAFCLQPLASTATGQFAKDRQAEKQMNTMLSGEAIDGEVINQSATRKIAPDLEEQTDSVFHNLRGDQTQKVIIQLKSETPLNETLDNLSDEAEQSLMLAEEVSKNKVKSGILKTSLMQVGGRFKKSFTNLGLVSAELPLSKISELSKNETVEYVSPDREVESFGHVEEVMSAIILG